MKQRNAAIAVWTALLISVGTTLAVAMSGNTLWSGADVFPRTQSELKPGERKLVEVYPDAAEVRLFVEGFPLREPLRTQASMSNIGGILLTTAQREILGRSLHRYRFLPSEIDASPACFIPHHFFRYYDASGKKIGELAVCYCCGGVEISGEGYTTKRRETWEFNFDAVEKMLKEMGVPTDVNC